VAHTIVSHHCTDEYTGGGQARRTVKNWQNYYDSSGLWAPVDLTLLADPPKPSDWPAGWPWPFTHAVLGNALQVALGDSSDASNTALLGFRSAARHECGVVIKPIGVNVVSPTVNADERSITWPGLWAYSDLTYQLANGRVIKTIRLAQAGHPTSFRFVYRLFPGMSAAIVNGRIEISDSQGSVVLVLVAPWGVDANGTAIRCAFSAAGTVSYLGVTCPTLRITPNATDLASATYPVEIDPTATISGTTDLTDNGLRQASANANYGSNPNGICGNAGTGSNIWRTIVKISTSAIPSGRIDAWSFKLYHNLHSTSQNADTLDMYRVLRDAPEGNTNGGTDTGSSCWNYAKYSTVAWTTAGCGSSGNDYNGSDSESFAYSAKTAGGDVLDTWSIGSGNLAWLSGWKIGSVSNYGVIIKGRGEADNSSYFYRSTEAASNQFSMSIDYTQAGAMPWMMMRRR
jgi:hypothetical protein